MFEFVCHINSIIQKNTNVNGIIIQIFILFCQIIIFKIHINFSIIKVNQKDEKSRGIGI